MEKNSYASIGRAITRRPAIPDGAAGFRYHAPVLTVLIVFLVLSTVELVIVDVLVHRWPLARIPLLILGIWGVVFMVGLLCSYIVWPHTVGPAGMRVRDGMGLDIDLPWADVYSVGRKQQFYPEKPLRVADEGEHRVLTVHIRNETNIEVVLEGLRPVKLRKGDEPEAVAEASVVRFWADDPKGLLAEVAKHIG